MAWSTSFKIEGLDKLYKSLSALEKDQFPFALKNTINDVATMVQRADKTQMVKDFDRPTPFTQNALKINYATKTRLSGGVVFKDPVRLSDSQHYLYHNVYGVLRGYKKFEGALYAKGILPAGHYAVPGKGMKLDAYGNVAAGTIVQILAWFGANSGTGFFGNSTDATKAKRKRGTKKKYGFEYFTLRKKNRNLLPGIYRRTITPFGTSLESMFIFIPRTSVGYQRTYSFFETSHEVFNNNFQFLYERNMRIALLTAFPR